MSRYRFRLFIAGDTARSHQAIENLRLLCQELGIEEPEIVIVDVVQHPDVADAERILTTPTLVKVEPAPVRRVTGDLSNRASVLNGLTLAAPMRSARPGGSP